MKKGIFIFFSLLIVQSIVSQTISKKDFLNSEWFSNNNDSLFFKSDTISLIKCSNLIESGKGYNIYHETYLLKNPESVIFEFKRYRKLNYWVTYYHQGSISKIGERTWKFDDKKNELTIYKKANTEWIFKIIGNNKIEFKSEEDELETSELIMIKMK
jgi:hypothetical protein